MDHVYLDIIKDKELDIETRLAIVKALAYAEDSQREHDLNLEKFVLDKRKFYWSTPIAVALASLVTLSATFVFDYWTRDSDAQNTMTVARHKTEMAAQQERLSKELERDAAIVNAKLSAEAEERKFQYEIVKSELANEKKNNVDRAETLLFLTKAGVLKQLDSDQLKKMAEEQLKNPSQSIIPNLTSITDGKVSATAANRLVPRIRPKMPSFAILATLSKSNHLVPEDRRDDKVLVLAVRGYYLNTMGKPNVNDIGIYDDAVFVVEPGGIHSFNANTDPSQIRERIATLKSNQAIRYKPGLHGINRSQPYPAFRQDSSVTVNREGGGEHTDSEQSRFMVNLHRGGVRTTSSAGSQTIPPSQWVEFKSLIDKLLERYDQKDFYYILIEQSDVVN